MYNIQKQTTVIQPNSVRMTCSDLNFPVNSFYNQDKNCIYCFYRQGEQFCYNRRNGTIEQTKIISKGESINQIYMIYNKILIIHSSDQVTFYKETEMKELSGQKKIEWKQYYSLDFGGFIYFIKGDNIMQITTPMHIYFYEIDQKTLIPSLLNSMYNFMDCQVMMFGSASSCCITYKMG